MPTGGAPATCGEGEAPVKRDELLTTIGVTAIGVVAGTLTRAVALGGKVVGTGLGALGAVGSVLRGQQEEAFTLREEPAPRPARTGFAPRSAPAFEPADGVTTPARTLTRRSSAEAAARTAPSPRPAQRATPASLPPSVRPVTPMRNHRATPDETPPLPPLDEAGETRPSSAAPGTAPVKAAAGAADQPPALPVANTAKKAAVGQAAAKKATVKKAAVKSAAGEKGAGGKGRARTAGTKAATKKAGPAKGAAARPERLDDPAGG